MRRRSFLKWVAAVPLAVKAGAVLAEKPERELPTPSDQRDEVPDGWTEFRRHPYMDARIYRHEDGRTVSVSGIAIACGHLYSVLKANEKGGIFRT